VKSIRVLSLEFNSGHSWRVELSVIDFIGTLQAFSSQFYWRIEVIGHLPEFNAALGNVALQLVPLMTSRRLDLSEAWELSRSGTGSPFVGVLQFLGRVVSRAFGSCFHFRWITWFRETGNI
jgi:hypothetical protein